MRGWTVIVLSLISVSGSAQVQQPKDDQTRKQLRLNHQKRINPATEIPRYAEYYAWKIGGKVNGQVVHETEVPVYAFDYGNFRTLGRVPIGTSITLDQFATMQGRLYYGLKITGPDGKEALGYVDGALIERDDANSYAPGK